jgi:dihydrolipoamide dehydrogenase
VAKVEPGDGGLKVSLSGEGACEPRTYDRILVAVGRSANVDELQLEKTKATINAEGFVEVDEQMRTQDPRIFAVGDVLGQPMLTLKATHQGRIAAEAIAGWGTFYDARAVPMVLFTDPQIAWCGMTERQAIAQDVPYAVHRTRWAQGGQTTGMQRLNGFTKIIYDLDAQVILGVGIVGPNAAELIAEGALAVEMGAVVSDLAATIHPHPTHSEFMGAAALEVERETQANDGA